MNAVFLVLSICAFLSGSIPTGYLVVKWRKGKDIRTKGSHSTGAANVARVCGRRWGLLTVLVDVMKGLIPTFIAAYFWGLHWETGVVGLLAVVGHIFPPFISKPRFKGGKGVATGIGALFPILAVTLYYHFFPWIIVLATVIAVWIAIIALTQRIGPASIILMGCILLLFIALEVIVHINFLAIPVLMMAALILWSHRENWERWRRGKERKVERAWEK
jgi:glycerol-3-phosphate acyltransferase PlsY